MEKLFDGRDNIFPTKYTQAEELIKAIRESYWLDTEVSFDIDKSEYNMADEKTKDVITKALLAISTVEVKVKDFWGNIGRLFPHPEISMLGDTHAESECYDEETEILTASGFKLFKDVGKDEKVACYNQDTGEIHFEVPSRHVAYDYKGIMHHYSSTSTDLKITPNHEILLYHPHTKALQKRESHEGKWGRNYLYPNSGLKTSGEKKLSDLDRLLIAIQADGSLRGTLKSLEGKESFRYIFYLTKIRKVERLKGILNSLGVDYNLSYPNRKEGEFEIRGSLEGLVSFKTIEKIKSFEFINLEDISSEWGKEFIEELSFWDSHTSDNGTVTYYNINEKAVKKVAAIASLSGLRANIGINRTAGQMLEMPLPGGGERKTGKDVYRVIISNHLLTTYPHRDEVEYDGKVYCVTVSTGNIVTKRHKRVVISGNCRHMSGYSRLLRELGLHELFLEVLKVPEINGRFHYLSKYLRVENDGNREDILIKIILFSVLIENVSLFGQFAIFIYLHKYQNIMVNTRNIIDWTINEETIHFYTGSFLVNTLREEYPELFTDKVQERVLRACRESIRYESNIFDWIFKEGEFEHMSKLDLVDFMKDRVNNSLVEMGFPIVFTEELNLKQTRFFYEETTSAALDDFFAKRPVDYAVKDTPITGDDLF